MLAAALAVTALGLAAGVLAASPARATPPAGVTTDILGSGTTVAGFKIHVTGITVESKNAACFTVAHLTFAPGGSTGWHVHPGPVLVIVTTGSVTKYPADDCTAHTYTAGQAFVENGPADENMVRNDGSVPAETIVTFITAPGAPIRDDAPAHPAVTHGSGALPGAGDHNDPPIHEEAAMTADDHRPTVPAGPQTGHTTLARRGDRR